MKNTSIYLLTSFLAVSTTINATEIVEIRNDSSKEYVLTYKGTNSTDISYQIKDSKIIDKGARENSPRQPAAPFLPTKTFSIPSNTTCSFKNLTIPYQVSIEERSEDFFSEYYINIEQVNPDGLVGTSHYIIFAKEDLISISKQSGSIYYKNWEQPQTYTSFAKARLIISDVTIADESSPSGTKIVGWTVKFQQKK